MPRPHRLLRAVVLTMYVATAVATTLTATRLLTGPAEFTQPPVLALYATLTAVLLAAVELALRGGREYLVLTGLPITLAVLTLADDLRIAATDSLSVPLLLSSAEMLVGIAVFVTLSVLTHPFRPRTPATRQSYARLLEFVRAYPGALLRHPDTGVAYECLASPPTVLRSDRAEAELPAGDADLGYATVEAYRFAVEPGILRRFTEQVPLRLDAEHVLRPVSAPRPPRLTWQRLVALRFSGRTGLGVVTADEADDLLRQLTEAEVAS